jgi:PKHD-type hydroxylase
LVTRTYLALAGAFSDTECDRIIALADEAPTEKAPLYGDSEPRVDIALRDAWSSQIARADAPWLFARLDALFAAAAAEFGLPVGPISEVIQVLLYGEGGHFRMWHTDAGTNSGERRRSSRSCPIWSAGRRFCRAAGPISSRRARCTGSRR